MNLFLLQAFWWTRGSIPRQRNGGKKKMKERQKKKKKPLLIFLFAFFECDPFRKRSRENASWASLLRGQMRVGTPTLVSGIRSLRNNRSQQTVPQPSPNGPRTNKKDSCSPRDSPLTDTTWPQHYTPRHLINMIPPPPFTRNVLPDNETQPQNQPELHPEQSTVFIHQGGHD